MGMVVRNNDVKHGEARSLPPLNSISGLVLTETNARKRFVGTSNSLKMEKKNLYLHDVS